MKKTLALLWLMVALSAQAGTLKDPGQVSRERYQIAENVDGQRRLLRIRFTCNKAVNVGKVSVEVSTLLGSKAGSISQAYGHCPTPDDVQSLIDEALGFSSSSTQTAAARQILGQTSPATNRSYIADTTGPNGRTVVDVISNVDFTLLQTIDVGDRLFGGLALNSAGTRLYILMWQTPAGQIRENPGPPFISYIDTRTNAEVDRTVLTDLLEPGKPVLSADGRFLYFSAQTATDGRRIRIVDLERKAIVGTFSAATPSYEPQAVALSPDGALLCASSGSGLTFYDVRTRTYLGNVPVQNPNSSLRPVFHPSGSKVYVLARALSSTFELSNFIQVVDTGTLRELTRIPMLIPAGNDFRPNLTRLAISPDGLRLVVDESFKGTAHFIDTRTNKIVRTVQNLSTGGIATAIVPVE